MFGTEMGCDGGDGGRIGTGIGSTGEMDVWKGRTSQGISKRFSSELELDDANQEGIRCGLCGVGANGVARRRVVRRLVGGSGM